jgi:hypothetical protein
LVKKSHGASGTPALYGSSLSVSCSTLAVVVRLIAVGRVDFHQSQLAAANAFEVVAQVECAVQRIMAGQVAAFFVAGHRRR